MKKSVEELLEKSMRRTDAIINVYKSEFHDEEVKQAAYSFAIKKELKLVNFIVKKSDKIEDLDGFYHYYSQLIFMNLMLIKKIARGKADRTDIANFYINARQHGFFKGTPSNG